jgi:hypothetical protein
VDASLIASAAFPRPTALARPAGRTAFHPRTSYDLAVRGFEVARGLFEVPGFLFKLRNA